MKPDLFTYRKADPDTSRQAGERNPLGRKTDRSQVLLCHYHHQGLGLTDFDLAQAMDRQQTSVGKRRGELTKLGFIEATSQRRPAPSGSPAIVWRITDKGRKLFEGD